MNEKCIWNFVIEWNIKNYYALPIHILDFSEETFFRKEHMVCLVVYFFFDSCIQRRIFQCEKCAALKLLPLKEKSHTSAGHCWVSINCAIDYHSCLFFSNIAYFTFVPCIIYSTYNIQSNKRYFASTFAMINLHIWRFSIWKFPIFVNTDKWQHARDTSPYKKKTGSPP